MKVLVVGVPNADQQLVLDRLAAEGVEVVHQTEQVVDRKPEMVLLAVDECMSMEIGHFEAIRYIHAGDFPVVPKKERNYPTLRQHLRGHR